jgi:hypothetical protein
MPGAFAHMIAADLAKKTMEDDGLPVATSLLKYPEWMQGGAVGPDYPYLHHVMTSQDASDSWANLLHYDRTGDVVREGVKILSARYKSEADKKDFMRALSWLMGYASHVVLDASIHPVVRAIVGEYETHAKEHRVCEMYMDAFIYKETYDVELTNAEWADYLLSLSEGDGMDNSIVTLWVEMIKKTYPDQFSSNPPQVHEWHKAYVTKLDSADSNVGFFRHLAGKEGILYVPVKEIPSSDMKRCVTEVKLPENNKFNQIAMHYKDVFEFGVDNVTHYWRLINDAICGTGDPLLPELLNWNLDKGTLIAQEDGDATLWV